MNSNEVIDKNEIHHYWKCFGNAMTTICLCGCKSWCIDETGGNSTILLSLPFTYRQSASKFKAEDYEGRLIGISTMNPTSLLHPVREKMSKVEVF